MKNEKILSAICYRIQVSSPSALALIAWKISFHPQRDISEENVDFKEPGHETVF